MMAAMTLFHAEKCCHVVSAHAASAQCICSSVRQFLIHSTFVIVVPESCIV